MDIRVDWRASLSLTGTILVLLSLPLLAPLGLALLDGTDPTPFIGAIVATLAIGGGCRLIDRNPEPGQREAFLMVASTWFGVALIGAIPFALAGTGTLAHPVNALFESMSGFTTTGATILADFSAHDRSILLWRQLLQWLGGLGILVIVIGLFSQLLVGGAQLMETESQTTSVRKLRPHLAETVSLIWWLYVGLTILATVVLFGLHLAGLAPEMDLFNAVSHAMTSVGTAGFSPQPESIAAFSPSVQWALIPFMILGATNFILLYYLARGEFSHLRSSEEFRFYLTILVGTSVILTGLVLLEDSVSLSGADAVRHGTFNAVSIITTTGFASTDFAQWGAGAIHILLLAMFVGGMAGSTTCSIKTIRWLVILKEFRRSLYTILHPSAVRPLRIGSDVVDEETGKDILTYVLLALLLFAALLVVLVIDAARTSTPVSEIEALGAAASIFLNIGPAFGMAGPMNNYTGFPISSRVVMILMMWVGRIEIIPVLVLLTRSYWTS